ncbi:hypothetical protein LCGC14_2659930 [marine sediment metagenome]|uniref:Uncharacterized protein n=1 Tax=marine sediment metagenome TaxID=412755 RepID=A0A0F9C2F8_9ZZZZ
MATIKDKCVFFAEADQCMFRTQTNGDKVWFGKGIHVRQDDAAAGAYALYVEGFIA